MSIATSDEAFANGVFQHTFCTELPGTNSASRQPCAMPNLWHAHITPEAASQPSLLAWNQQLAEDMGSGELGQLPQAAAELLTGQRLHPDMRPYAGNYVGHQFGHFAGQLGDGRAITLGEWMHGDRRFELQLKGAGRTPFSRHADGRAVLRSSIREYLVSEAMHALGVPTTRALSLCGTGDTVLRDVFYDGHPAHEPSAIVCRVAPSFLRFGHMQMPVFWQNQDAMRAMFDYLHRHFFADIQATGDEAVAAIFTRICQTTADLMVDWQRFGFVHAVMNTDNMSLLGLTLDYGPFGFLDDYAPNWTPNTSDTQGRYAYANQPHVAGWNLAQLGSAMAWLMDDHQALQDALHQHYTDRFQTKMASAEAAKLGFAQTTPDINALSERWKQLMIRGQMDFTLAHRHLANIQADTPLIDDLGDVFYDEHAKKTVAHELHTWLSDYAALLQKQDIQDSERQQAMNQVNPKYVLRNHIAQRVIERAHDGDFSELQRAFDCLQKPFDEQTEHQDLAQKRPDWAKNCTRLSCSS